MARKFLKNCTLKFTTTPCRRQEGTRKLTWVHNYIPFGVQQHQKLIFSYNGFIAHKLTAVAKFLVPLAQI